MQPRCSVTSKGSPAHKKRFGVRADSSKLVGRPVITPRVLVHLRTFAVSSAARLWRIVLMRAIAPETCGVAIEVPERATLPVSEVTAAASTLLPGARISTHAP